MDFKPAICPSCGGKLQLPDNLATAKCSYCGVDVVVQDAIKLSGRVKEFTQAEPVKKVTEWKPFDAQQANNPTFILISVLGIIGLLISLCIGSSNKPFGVIMGITFLIVISFLYFKRPTNTKKFQKAVEEMQGKDSPVSFLVGYKGHCPYCDSTITRTQTSIYSM